MPFTSTKVPQAPIIAQESDKSGPELEMPPKAPQIPSAGTRPISSFFTPPSSSTPGSNASGTKRSAPPTTSSRPPPSKRLHLEDLPPSQSSSSQWRFNKTREGPPVPAPRSAEQEKQHRAFRKVLLGPENPLDRRRAEVEPSAASAPEDIPNRSISPVPEEKGASADLAINVDDSDSSSESSLPKASLARYASGKRANPTGIGKQETASNKRNAKGKGKALGPDGIAYTPLEMQILQLKAEHPGVLLIIEVGYKLKFYGEDARIASRELSIVRRLQRKRAGCEGGSYTIHHLLCQMCFPERHLMTAMIPVHRLHIHVKRLIAAGHKVGVVRQTETRALKAASSNASAPFTRKLTALYTASTWVDDIATVDLEEGSAGAAASNSLVAVVERVEGGSGHDERVSIGLVSMQIATGAIIYDQFSDGNMRSELETRMKHLQPSELLLPATLSKQTDRLLRYLAGRSSEPTGRVRLERISDVLGYNEALRAVTDFYEKDRSSDEADGSALQLTSQARGELLTLTVSLPHLVLVALAGAIRHLTSFGLSSIFRVTANFQSFATRSNMLLTGNTLSNLEIFHNADDGREKGSLIWLLDKCTTVMGKRLLRKWVAHPLIDRAQLTLRGDAVQEMIETKGGIPGQIRDVLKGTPDLEKGLARLNYGRTTPDELATILLALNRITLTFDFSTPEEVGLRSELLNQAVAAIPTGRRVATTALAAISVKHARENDKADLFTDINRYPKLQDIKEQIKGLEAELAEHLKELRTFLKRSTLRYIEKSGIAYLVEVRVADAKKMPSDWLRINSTKDFVRFHTPVVLRLTKRRDRYMEMLTAEADAAFKDFCGNIANEYVTLRNVVTSLATLDALVSLSLVGQQAGYVRPKITDDLSIRLDAMRHPIIEAVHDSGYVANDVILGPGAGRGILLTGSNMGGKSSTVRAVALCVLLAQIGSYVPCDQAEVGLHDAILTRMGASDELAKGRSTFMMEVGETAEIIRTATERSLVILDELGRGTSTHDGMSIAYAVLVHLLSRANNLRPKLLFITHYLGLGTVVERSQGELKGMHMAFLQEDSVETAAYSDSTGETVRTQGRITFLYKLADGLADRSFGIHCGALAGLPEQLLAAASEKSEHLRSVTQQKEARGRAHRAAKIISALKEFENIGEIRTEDGATRDRGTLEVVKKLEGLAGMDWAADLGQEGHH